MKRRALLMAGGAALGATALRSIAQASRQIAILLTTTPSATRAQIEVFRAELARLGHVEGRDVAFEIRWAENRTERLEPFAAELVRLKPAAMLTTTSAGILACRKATTSIPIVFATGSRVVEQGLAVSLRRPGGNITGVIVHQEIEKKLVEVSRQALPQAKRLATLAYVPDPVHKQMMEQISTAATQFGFVLTVGRVKRVEDLATVFNEILTAKPEALVLPTLSFMYSNTAYLVERSLAAKLPLVSAREEATAAGALLSYGTQIEENYRRAAALMDKILRGAKPAELPIEQPERFRLIVNSRTAHALGVTVSQALMMRADKVL